MSLVELDVVKFPVVGAGNVTVKFPPQSPGSVLETTVPEVGRTRNRCGELYPVPGRPASIAGAMDCVPRAAVEFPSDDPQLPLVPVPFPTAVMAKPLTELIFAEIRNCLAGPHGLSGLKASTRTAGRRV